MPALRLEPSEISAHPRPRCARRLDGDHMTSGDGGEFGRHEEATVSPAAASNASGTEANGY